MFHKVGPFAITYTILFVIFIALLYITALIPNSALQKNVSKSAAVLMEEGTYPSFGVPWRKIVLDNYTDPIMLNTAYSLDSSKPFESMLQNKRYDDFADRTD